MQVDGPTCAPCPHGTVDGDEAQPGRICIEIDGCNPNRCVNPSSCSDVKQHKKGKPGIVKNFAEKMCCSLDKGPCTRVRYAAKSTRTVASSFRASSACPAFFFFRVASCDLIGQQVSFNILRFLRLSLLIIFSIYYLYLFIYILLFFI